MTADHQYNYRNAYLLYANITGSQKNVSNSVLNVLQAFYFRSYNTVTNTDKLIMSPPAVTVCNN